MTLKELVKENNRRNMVMEEEYDPIKGIGCYGKRVMIDSKRWNEGIIYLPESMVKDKEFKKSVTKSTYQALRYKYDFEYWCSQCIKIKDKKTRKLIPFVLNKPQRKLLGVFEELRQNGAPVRVILLKARQWGGSTLTQIYMAWWQIILYENCNSVIASHLKDTSTMIKAMYSSLLTNYEG